jgi:hypothetical protein
LKHLAKEFSHNKLCHNRSSIYSNPKSFNADEHPQKNYRSVDLQEWNGEAILNPASIHISTLTNRSSPTYLNLKSEAKL